MIALRPEPQTRLIVVALRRVRQAGLEGGLAGGRLADAGLQHLAHQDVVDRRGRRVEAGPLDRRADGDPAELGGRDAAQRTAELADRRARGADDEDVAVRAACMHRESTPELASGPPGRRGRRRLSESRPATITRWIWLVPS